VGQPVLKLMAGNQKSYVIKIVWKGVKLEAVKPVVTAGRLQLIDLKESRFLDPQHLIGSNAGHQTEIAANSTFGYHTYFVENEQGAFKWWQPINMNIIYQDSDNTHKITDWHIIPTQKLNTETIDLKPYFNDKLTNIFKNQYLSPRPTSPTLQLPTQGIGNWAYPLVTANIDDSGLKKAAINGVFTIPQGIPFATPAGR
jgi:hypothetical protein